jgi:peptidoglycan hydrolase-like amidase
MGNKLLFVRRILIILLCCAPYISAQGARDTFSFGVFSLFKPTRLLIHPANNNVLLLTTGKSSSRIGSEVEVRSTDDGLRITANSHSYNAASILITSRDGSAADFVLALPGKISRSFRGTVEITQSSRGRLQPIVSIERELAIASAVAAEATPGAPLEALKAQAVVARSFYLGSRNRHQDFDFCDTTHCQLLKEPPRPNSPASIAARQTRGLTLHFRGEIVAAMFSASCGGRTRTLADLGIVSEGYPYYSVEDAYCDRKAKRWRY